MSGVEESKGGATESKESSGSAIAAEWGGMPIKAEDSVVLCPKNEMGYPPLVYFVRAWCSPRWCLLLRHRGRCVLPDTVLICGWWLPGRH